VRELGERLPDWITHGLGGASLACRPEPELEDQRVAEALAPKLAGVRLPRIGAGDSEPAARASAEHVNSSRCRMFWRTPWLG